MIDIYFEEMRYLWFLLFIPVIIVVHYLVLRLTKKQGIPFANYETLSRISKKYVFAQNNLQLMIRILCVILVVFSLANPIAYYDKPGASENTVILLDASDSMFVTYDSNSSWSLANDVLNDFLSERDYSTSLGLLTYSTITKIDVPPTKSRVDALAGYYNLKGHDIGGTDLGVALLNAAFLVSTQQGAKKIVILTDGESSFGSSMAEALQTINENHLRVDAVAINLKRSDEENALYLKKIAEISGGYFKVLTNDNVGDVITTLLYSPSATVYVNLRDLLLILALMMLTLEWALSKSIFKTLPHE